MNSAREVTVIGCGFAGIGMGLNAALTALILSVAAAFLR